ncbi:hypothetical protein HK098_002244 [Nowakowskiella sp. JEL0407]|nr:hypothetical protein HK098_002244 [Nowakowskiella sp. JEL0407]
MLSFVSLNLNPESVALAFPLMAREFPAGLEASRVRLIDSFVSNCTDEFKKLAETWILEKKFNELDQLLLKSWRKQQDDQNKNISFPTAEQASLNVPLLALDALLSQLTAKIAVLTTENQDLLVKLEKNGAECEKLTGLVRKKREFVSSLSDIMTQSIHGR